MTSTDSTTAPSAPAICPLDPADARPRRILLLGQGRATSGVAMGHIRVTHAIEVGAAHVDTPMEYGFVDVPPFSLRDRVLARRIPGLDELDFFRLRWHLLRSLAARRLASRHLLEHEPDVIYVITDQVSLLMSGLQPQVPCVPSLDSTTLDWLRMLRAIGINDTPIDLRTLATMERRALTQAPLSIAWTQTVRRRAQQLAPEARVEVLHPGLDLERFRPGSPRPSRAPLRVLFVGGAWERKGGPDLLAALDPLLGREVALDVVTSAVVHERPGVNVHRLSPASDELLSLFRQADMVCLPTSCDAVPWVVVEALACGVPVVASDVGSIPELVDDAGLIFPVGAVRSLREAITTLAGDPGRREAMGARARTSAERRFDARVNTPRLFELLDGVARANGR